MNDSVKITELRTLPRRLYEVADMLSWITQSDEVDSGLRQILVLISNKTNAVREELLAALRNDPEPLETYDCIECGGMRNPVEIDHAVWCIHGETTR